MEIKDIECLLEGILFAAGDPVSQERLCKTLKLDQKTVDTAAKHLSEQYKLEHRGIRLLKLEGTYQLCSAPEYAECIRQILNRNKPPRLSSAALEVASIVAYYQPVTRAYIDQFRGVDSAYTINLLLERGMIVEDGRLAVPGRPILYRTTNAFLRVFGLSSLEELPELPQNGEESNH
ncbi:MAG: SMC-Scp complex subunit ScpB [Oscillospiraceae bacterium]|nr:SMC-Scp complex subunit ScpB [Oscillospiraceae bacterium]